MTDRSRGNDGNSRATGTPVFGGCPFEHTDWLDHRRRWRHAGAQSPGA